MSGAIRSSMGPALKRLKTMIEVVIPILNKGQIGDRDVKILKLNGIKMRNVIQSLEAKNAEWLDFMKGLPALDRPAEERKYEGFKYEESHFYEWIEKGKDVLEDIEQTEGINEVPFPQQDGNQGQRNAPRDPTEGIHLERVTLPQFRGDPHEWPHFWQLFESLVEKGNYAPVVKLHYLVGCLRGEAKEAIQDVGIAGENYQMVKDILKERFGDKSVLVEALQAELVRLPSATESPLSLKRTVDNLEKIFRQLKALGTDVNSDMMSGLIKAKLPRGILMKLAEKEASQNTKWSPKEFREALVEFVRIQEAVFQSTKHFHAGNQERVHDSSEKGDHRRFGRNDREQLRYDQSQTRNFQTMQFENFQGNPRYRDSRKIQCLFCEGNHLAHQCDKVLDRENRVKKLTEQRRCFRCLKYGHLANQCRSNRNCPACNGLHHVVICPRRVAENANWNWNSRNGFESKPQGNCGTSSNTIPLGKRGEKAPSQEKSNFQKSNTNCTWGGNPEEVEDQPVVQTVNHLSIQEVMGNRPGDTILMAQKVPVCSPRGNGKVYEALVFFDTGSQTSYVSEKLVKKLNPPKVGEGYLEVKAFRSSEPMRFKSGKYVLELHRRDGKKEQMVMYSSGSFANGFKAAIVNHVSEEPTLKEIRRNLEWLNQEPDILIGVAEFWKFFLSKRDLAEDFFLIETTVGPVVCGREQLINAGKEWKTRTSVSIHASNEEQVPEEKTIATWWDLQTLGIKDDPNEDEDEASEILFEKSIRQVDGRYRTKWLWKDENPNLPSNFGLAYRCLESILRRLQGMPDSDLLEKYDAKIKEQLEKDIIEVASRNEGNLEHYLPHHPVVTHKLRLVYNASAKVRNGKSLNECLYRGTVLLPELVGMLLRFRLPKYVLLGDIEAAFLQIELEEPDREVAKFLWVSDIHAPPTKRNLVIYRFKRVAFGVICSPFLLSATIQHHLKKYLNSELAKELWDNTYMDNLMMSGESENEILGKYTESKEIFKDAKMNVREYITNAPGIMERIPKEDQLETVKPKVLGIRWDLASDCLEIKFPCPKEEEVVTQRGVLQTLSSLFDPLGVLSPCVVEAKLFFQELWNLAPTWDEVLPESAAEKWRNLMGDWKDQVVLIPRRIGLESAVEYQLHAFVDASKDVYAAAIYLRSESLEGLEAHLVFSKNRLKSKSGKITIPRMELLAILIGVRALKFVETELKLRITEKHVWSDSQAALSWVNLDNAETKPRFVANRLLEIRQHRDCIFHHVKSEENPADLATRGMTPEEIRNSELWWKGPSWLTRPSNEWNSIMEITVPEPTDLMEQWETAQVRTQMALVMEEHDSETEVTRRRMRERLKNHRFGISAMGLATHLGYRRLGRIIFVSGHFWLGGTLDSVDGNWTDSLDRGRNDSWSPQRCYINREFEALPFIFSKMEDQWKREEEEPAKEKQPKALLRAKERFLMPLLCYMEILAQGNKEGGTLEEIFGKKESQWKTLVSQVEATMRTFRAKMVVTKPGKRVLDYLRFSDQPATQQLAIYPDTTLQRACEIVERPLRRPNLPGIKEWCGTYVGLEEISLKFGTWEECRRAIQTYRWDTDELTWEESTGESDWNSWKPDFEMGSSAAEENLESDFLRTYRILEESEPGTSRGIMGREESRARKRGKESEEGAIESGKRHTWWIKRKN